MAKKKGKSKNHLPKRIAGVKVPKRIRRGRFGALLASPAGQEWLAGALLSAGGVALAAREAREGSASRQLAAKAKHAAQDEAHDVSAGASIFAHALGEAARSFAEALQSRSPLHAGTWSQGESPSAPGAKKKPPPTPQPGL